MSLKINFCGMDFDNPLVLSSGILGLSAETMLRVVNNGAGGVTTKGIGKDPRKGHPNPTVLGTDNFTINAVGLSNPGVDNYQTEVQVFKKNSRAPLLGNIFASTFTEMAEIGKKMEKFGADAVELNISCPNMEPGEKIGMWIGQNSDLVKKGTSLVKEALKIPVIVKLTPNVNDIAEIAKAAESGGADAISAINTLGPGMIIDTETGCPVLANKFGGVGGPAIKPIAIASVYKIYQVVKIPIMGIGGINKAEDVIEMMMAGAALVGLGSAVYYREIKVFNQIKQNLIKWIKAHPFNSLQEIIGLAHKK